MKIAFLITDITTGGGIERVTSNLSAQFIRESYDVTIISCFKCNSKPIFQINEAASVHYLTQKTYTSALSKIQRLRLIKGALNSLRKFLAKNQFDFIIAQAFLPTFLLFLIPKRIGCQIIICEHFKFDLYGKIMTSIRNHVYRKIGKVITLTAKDEERYRAIGIGAETIPNMITFPIEEHNYMGKRLISVGRLHPQKGYDMLIHACSYVFEKHPDWQLDIYGEGEERGKLQDLINSLSLSKNISLKGYSTDIHKELSTSDICVVSSRYEGFPMSITESLALGTPVVSFDCPEGPSVLLAGEAGLLIPQGDIQGLSNGLCKMIESQDLREKCRYNGYKNIVSYTAPEIMKKWKKLLTTL